MTLSVARTDTRFGFFVAAVALTLSGCGGDVGTDSSDGLSLQDKWQRFGTGNPTLSLTSEQIERTYDSRSRAASHSLSLTWSASAFGGEEQFDVDVEPHEHEDLRADLPPGSTLSFASVLERNDVRIAELKARYTHRDEYDGEAFLGVDVVYGGWLDHTVFGVGFHAGCYVNEPGCSGTSPVYAWGDAYGLTPFGVYPGTSPTGMGSAAWTGVMVGMESPSFWGDVVDIDGMPSVEYDGAAAAAWANEGPPDVYLGDARIEIDNLSAPDVDVSFTNIHNVTQGTPHRDMIWEGLSVENGLFRRGNPDDEYIAGMFTGLRHQEVGGEFRRDGIAGGFGAKRQ